MKICCLHLLQLPLASLSNICTMRKGGSCYNCLFSRSRERLTVHICSMSFQSVTIPCCTQEGSTTMTYHWQLYTLYWHTSRDSSILTSTGYFMFSNPLCSCRHTHTYTQTYTKTLSPLCTHTLYENLHTFLMFRSHSRARYVLFTSALGPMNMSPSSPPVITRACFGLPMLYTQ